MREELEFVRRRPGLTIGADGECFTALVGYINGYQARYHARYEVPINPSAEDVRERACLVPHAFHLFVAAYFGCDEPGGKGWQHFVREHADGEQAAFRLFFELLDEFERQQPSA